MMKKPTQELLNSKIVVEITPKICTNCHPSEWVKYQSGEYAYTIDEHDRCLRCKDCERKIDAFEVIYARAQHGFKFAIGLNEKYKRDIPRLKEEVDALSKEIKRLKKLKSKVIHGGFGKK